MSQVERIYKIHRWLQAGKPLTARKISENLEVTERTVHRDIEYLKERLLAPLIWEHSEKTWRYDPDEGSFELPGFWLTPAEIRSLMLMQSLIEKMEPGPLGELFEDFQRRVEGLVKDLNLPPAEFSSRMKVIRSQARLPEGRVFEQTCQYLLERKVMQIQYHGRNRDEVMQRTIHPQQIVLYKDGWYLAAWCEMRREMRVFAIERIREVLPCEQLECREIPVDEDYVSSGFGLFAGGGEHWATLRFHQPNARWVADEIWHSRQEGRWERESYILKLPYTSLHELTMEVLRHGHCCQVLEPLELQNQVKEELKQALMAYSSK